MYPADVISLPFNSSLRLNVTHENNVLVTSLRSDVALKLSREGEVDNAIARNICESTWPHGFGLE